ncbi:galactoside-binding lectin [Teladorsagia circumcincta]|uniref:Galectin n=1 Tax=Teladorsagia circumcincta TaxID=45464 RepID=A0A2G9V3K5_TELCI|nr:galactoside-binding lectin [Teladorsagia circumcincta]
MHNVFYPPVPSAIPIREKLRSGCDIDVYGKVNHGSHKNFSIELLSGPHIVLHINFRFQHSDKQVVMNSYSGAWGQEACLLVRHDNPLGRDDSFQLHIHCQHNYYEVIELNGTPLANFTHRFPMESVQALGMKGDVTIEKVLFSGFDFGTDWCGDHDYGHAGYGSYGLDHYEPPVFGADHAYNAYF